VCARSQALAPRLPSRQGTEECRRLVSSRHEGEGASPSLPSVTRNALCLPRRTVSRFEKWRVQWRAELRHRPSAGTEHNAKICSPLRHAPRALQLNVPSSPPEARPVRPAARAGAVSLMEGACAACPRSVESVKCPRASRTAGVPQTSDGRGRTAGPERQSTGGTSRAVACPRTAGRRTRRVDRLTAVDGKRVARRSGRRRACAPCSQNKAQPRPDVAARCASRRPVTRWREGKDGGAGLCRLPACVILPPPPAGARRGDAAACAGRGRRRERTVVVLPYDDRRHVPHTGRGRAGQEDLCSAFCCMAAHIAFFVLFIRSTGGCTVSRARRPALLTGGNHRYSVDSTLVTHHASSMRPGAAPAGRGSRVARREDRGRLCCAAGAASARSHRARRPPWRPRDASRARMTA
jgi:hypothetical protein